MVVEGPSRPPPPTSPSHAKTILQKQTQQQSSTSAEDHPTLAHHHQQQQQRKSQHSQSHATMVVVESMLQSAVDVVKTSFTSPCVYGGGGDQQAHKNEKKGKKKTPTSGPYQRSLVPLSAITSSTFSVDSCDDSHAVCDGGSLASPSSTKRNEEAVAAAERRLAEAERRLAAAVAHDKRCEQEGKEEEEEESRDQSMNDPRQEQPDQWQHHHRRKEGRNAENEDCGTSRTEISAGYGLVPEQITFEVKDMAVVNHGEDSSSATSTSRRYLGGNRNRPPIAKPPTHSTGPSNRRGSSNANAFAGPGPDPPGKDDAEDRSGSTNIAGNHERTPSDGSGDSFVQGEALLSTSGDDNHGHNRQAYNVSVFASYSSASETAADEVNASNATQRAGSLSPPRTGPPVRDGLTVTTAASSSQHDTPQPRSPAVPFSPGAHSSCTNPSYISSSSEDDDDDDLFDLESLQGDLYKIVQIQQQQSPPPPPHHDDEEQILVHAQSPPDASSSSVLADVTAMSSSAFMAEGAGHEEYNIQEGDSREWLRLDSLSGDGRPMPEVRTSSKTATDDADKLTFSPTDSNQNDQKKPLASSCRKFFSERSSSLSLDVIEDAVSPRSESTRGGLATLDAILMASSSLSIDTDDEYIADENEKASGVQGSKPTSMRPGISESLRSALEELEDHDDDDNDSFNYGSALKTVDDLPKGDADEEALGPTTSSRPGTSIVAVSASNYGDLDGANEAKSGVADEPVASKDPTSTVIPGYRCNTLSDVSAERAPVELLDSSVFGPVPLDTLSDSVEKRLKERTRLVMKELEHEYQQRVERMKHQYSVKLQRLRRQLDRQFEHDLEEQMRRVETVKCIDNVEKFSSQKGVLAVVEAPAAPGVVEEARTVEVTQPTTLLEQEEQEGDVKVPTTKKLKKDAMEERLQSLMLRFNAPAAQTNRSNNRPSDTSTVEAAVPKDDGRNPKKAGSDETRSILRSISKTSFEPQQNWLRVDLEHNADDNVASLQVEFEAYRQRQANAFEELQSLEQQCLLEETQRREERTEAEKMYKTRIDEFKAKARQTQDDNEEICAGIQYEIGKEEAECKALRSRLQEAKNGAAALEEKGNEQTDRIKYLRAESEEVRERLRKLTDSVHLKEREGEERLHKEKAKTDKAIAHVQKEVSAAIEVQFSEGNKKSQALLETEEKVVERLGALQKLLAITETSRASSTNEYAIKETELSDEYQRLEEAIVLTEERKSNKAVAFTRVVSQLNQSSEALTRAINISRDGIDASQKQTEEMKTEMLQLTKDNTQVNLWISELKAVLKSMGRQVHA